MAIEFNGSNQYLEGTHTPITSWPMTLSIHFNADAINAYYTAFSVTDASEQFQRAAIRMRGDQSGDYLEGFVEGGANVAKSSTGFSANTWHHACFVATGDNERSIQLDAGGKVTDFDGPVTWASGADTITIGQMSGANPEGYFNGSLAEAAMYNVALTDAEVAQLSLGVSPLLVRTSGLVAYWPLIRDGRDIVGGYDLTLFNSPTIDRHPSNIIYPSNLYVPSAAIASQVLQLETIIL